MVRNRIIPIFVPHLGCPHQCVFCNQRSIAGVTQPCTTRDVTTLLQTGVRCAGGCAEVAFYGGSFTAIPAAQQEALLGAVQPFLRSGEIASIRLSTRPDAIDEEVIRRLQHFGVKTVELGSQSMDDAVLRRSQRGHRAEDTETACRMLQQAGCAVILQMMTGLPGSGEKTDLETARRMIELKPDGVRIYPTVVVEGTLLESWYRQGIYQPQTTAEAATRCAKLYRMFLNADIPVLRMGLQPTEDLSGGKAIAGPYHPAFGELVKSQILYETACAQLDQTEESVVTLLVRKDRVSAMVGQKRENLRKLQARYPDKTLKVGVGACKEWEIVLQSAEKLDKIT